MEIGVYGVVTDETLRPDEIARLVEDAGLDAFHIGEHSHIPASRETPAPGGGELRRDYIRLYDLFVALTAAGVATTRLRLSSGIMQLAQRDPIITAKEIASLDQLTGGRVDLIVGHGWNIEEMRNHGVDPDTRYDLVREKMLAMREMFREDEASFHGEFVNFDRIWSWPKPVQPGGVPLFFGGNSPGSEERALEYGDGWAPIAIPGTADRIRSFVEAGHTIPVIAFGVATDPAAIEEYASAGAHRVVLDLGPAQPGVIERSLEELRECIATAVG
jgi:probable F420-dependent oxidoreductase